MPPTASRPSGRASDVTLLVDTSVGSRALRRDAHVQKPKVQTLKDALGGADVVVTTGLVLQELLQGFSGPKAPSAIVERFSAPARVHPGRDDYIAAAAIRNTCRHRGVQIGTVDALNAQLCISNDLTLLTTDKDFSHAAKHCRLRVWSPNVRRGRDAWREGAGAAQGTLRRGSGQALRPRGAPRFIACTRRWVQWPADSRAFSRTSVERSVHRNWPGVGARAARPARHAWCRSIRPSAAHRESSRANSG